MVWRIVSLVVVGALTLSGVAIGQDRTKRALTGSVKLAPISVSGELPELNVRVAGRLRARPGGRGAIVGSGRYTGSPASNVYTFAGTFTAFQAHGSLTGRLTGRATVEPTTNAWTIRGTVTVSRGTERYRGATGTVRFTGSAASATSVATLALRGSLTY